MTSKFLTYCAQFKTNDTDVANFQFQPGGVDKGWKLSVPKERLTEFWDKYYELRVERGEASHLLERPGKEYNVMKIDLDLKQEASREDMQTSTPAHKYDHEAIKMVIEHYVKAAATYIQLPVPAYFTVFEKKTGKLKTLGEDKQQSAAAGGIQGYVKDGIHIMCPEIIAPNPILHAIYECFIKMPEIMKMNVKFENVEPTDVMFDSKVISTNAWFPVGSGKPEDNKDYYCPTRTYMITEDMTLEACDLGKTVKEQIVYFSNIGKEPTVELNPGLNLDTIRSQVAAKTGKPATLTPIDKLRLMKLVPSKDLNKKPLDMPYIEHLLMCLSKERCRNYSSWYNVGICLYNISPHLVHMFDKWSSMVPEKYDGDAVLRYWYENFTKNSDRYSLGIDKLKQYAREDNEELYYKCVNIHRTKFIENMVTDLNTGMHKNKVAHVDLTKKLKEYIELQYR